MQIQNDQIIAAARQSELPVQIYLQLIAAEEEYNRWLSERERYKFSTPTPGRPRKAIKYKVPVVIFGDTEDALNVKLELLKKVLGPKAVGNKRHAHVKVYNDLLDVFIDLKNRNVRLTKGGSLSSKAALFGVGRVLKDHHYTSHEVEHLAKDSKERLRVGKVMKSMFQRVADVVEANA